MGSGRATLDALGVEHALARAGHGRAAAAAGQRPRLAGATAAAARRGAPLFDQLRAVSPAVAAALDPNAANPLGGAVDDLVAIARAATRSARRPDPVLRNLKVLLEELVPVVEAAGPGSARPRAGAQLPDAAIEGDRDRLRAAGGDARSNRDSTGHYARVGLQLDPDESTDSPAAANCDRRPRTPRPIRATAATRTRARTTRSTRSRSPGPTRGSCRARSRRGGRRRSPASSRQLVDAVGQDVERASSRAIVASAATRKTASVKKRGREPEQRGAQAEQARSAACGARATTPAKHTRAPASEEEHTPRRRGSGRASPKFGLRLDLADVVFERRDRRSPRRHRRAGRWPRASSRTLADVPGPGRRAGRPARRSRAGHPGAPSYASW